jgi:hypothetical protein
MTTDQNGRRVIDSNARRRALERLVTKGEIFDASGRAASILRSDIGYLATSAGFAQLLASMERAGEIRREIRGKRTYRITMGPNADLEDVSTGLINESAPEDDATSPVVDVADDTFPVAVSDEIDYDELGLAVLRSAARALLGQPVATEGGLRPMSTGRAQRRIVSLERNQAELERAVARANAERAEMAAQNAELRGQLDAATRTIDTLKGQLERRPSRAPAGQRLDHSEMAVLRRLMQPASSSAPASGPEPDAQTG